YGSVVGAVRDASSREPIPSTSVTLSPASTFEASHGVVTDTAGRYELNTQPLGYPGNVAQPISMTARPPFNLGYWPGSASGLLTANHTATVDVDVIKVCTAATISGTVVHDLT